MAREAGKGSKVRPYSISSEQFNDNWNMIFMKNKPTQLVNPLNQEKWVCEDFNDVRVVDSVEYVTVYKAETPNRLHLMRKDALRQP